MMRPTSLFAVALAVLAIAPAAFAKGPSEASISGPGGQGPTSFTGNGEGPGSPLGNLAAQAGFFPAVFQQTPDPMLAERPPGELGPKYTVTYTVPGPDGSVDEIQQDLYPYAADGPVTYTAPGQPVFGTEETHGGWFRASPALKDLLVDAGLPARAPTADGESTFDGAWIFVLAGAAALALVAASLVAVRRRPRPAGAP